MDKEKGFRFGYSGMVVVIRGHEEIFFEFASHGLRDDCTVTILRALDALQRSNDLGEESVGEGREPDDAADEDLLLQRARLGKDVVHDTSVPLAVEKLGESVQFSRSPTNIDDVQSLDSLLSSLTTLMLLSSTSVPRPHFGSPVSRSDPGETCSHTLPFARAC